MQRFRLMKIYVAAVLMVLVVAISSAAWFGPFQAAGTSTDADPLLDDANATQPGAGNVPAHADATKPDSAE
jgi:hypothetical protein